MYVVLRATSLFIALATSRYARRIKTPLTKLLFGQILEFHPHTQNLAQRRTAS